MKNVPRFIVKNSLYQITWFVWRFSSSFFPSHDVWPHVVVMQTALEDHAPWLPYEDVQKTFMDLKVESVVGGDATSMSNENYAEHGIARWVLSWGCYFFVLWLTIGKVVEEKDGTRTGVQAWKQTSYAHMLPLRAGIRQQEVINVTHMNFTQILNSK